MCTVSWRIDSDGYTLFSSRDELLTRPIADAPRWQEHSGVAYVAPSDTLHGGTWISANARGLSVCILNAQHGPRGTRSRGEVVRLLASSLDIEGLSTTLTAARLEQFSPFVLIALGRHRAARIFEWDHGHLTHRDAPLSGVLTSSSFDDEGVRAARVAQFERAVDLEAFHRSHEPRPGAHSVCMHRSDAKTVSLTRIEVTRSKVGMSYWPGSPCERN